MTLAKFYIAEVDGEAIGENDCHEAFSSVELAKGGITTWLEDHNENSGHAIIYECTAVLEGDVTLTADWKPVPENKKK